MNNIKEITYSSLKVVILFTIFFYATSCSTTRMLDDEQLLLNKYKIKSKDKRLSKDELNIYVRQKPNKKIFGFFKFKLHVYSAFYKNDKNINKWFIKNLGEEPIIYDSLSVIQTEQNFERYLRNKGFYSSNIYTKIKTRNKKVKTTYCIEAGRPYYIQQIEYNISDNKIDSIVKSITKDSHLSQNMLFDTDILNKERERLTIEIRRNGYYYFNKEYISFLVDSAFQSHTVKIELQIDSVKQTNRVKSSVKYSQHKQFKVRNIYIISDFDTKKYLEDKKKLDNQFDTVYNGKNIYFLYKKSPNINPKVIMRSLYIESGDLYDIQNITQTQRQLSNLKYIKLVNFEITDVSDSLSNVGELDYLIQITPFTSQSYSVNLEGTNTSGDWGTQVYFSYQHKNLFRAAENFIVKLKAAAEMDKTTTTETDQLFFNTEEYGIDLKLEIPKFLLPFVKDDEVKKRIPQTHISGGYSFLKSTDYTRPNTYVKYGYFWRGKSYFNHTLNPIEINGIKYHNFSENFKNYILSNQYYKFSFENYFIQSSNYTVIFNNQLDKQKKNYNYIKFMIESAGNVTNMIYTVISPNADSIGNIFDSRYARYLKSECDFRFYNVISKERTTVYRIFAGVAMPIESKNAVPFVKKYYVGGSNSLRGWQARTLSATNNKENSIIDYYMGDIKLEANIEQRFHILWKIDGAIFTDIGNIWTFHEVENQSISQFKIDEFISQLAISVGFGIRLDLSFFIFRLDWGFKALNPMLNTNKWILGNESFKKQNWNLSFGIGYPF